MRTESKIEISKTQKKNINIKQFKYDFELICSHPCQIFNLMKDSADV